MTSQCVNGINNFLLFQLMHTGIKS